VACVVAGAPAFGAAGFAAGFAGGFAAGAAGAAGVAGCCASATPIAPAEKAVMASAMAALRVVVRRAHTIAFFIGNLTLWPPHGLVKSRSKSQSKEADAMPETGLHECRLISPISNHPPGSRYALKHPQPPKLCSAASAPHHLSSGIDAKYGSKVTFALRRAQNIWSSRSTISVHQAARNATLRL
jgi:hypothetical protein